MPTDTAIKPTLVALLQKHDSAQQTNSLFFSDIGRDYRLPYQVAIDIAAQTSDALLQSVYQLIDKPIVSKHYPEPVDWWMDIEAIGNFTAIKAKDLAYIIFKHFQESGVMTLVVSGNGYTLGYENFLFLTSLLNFLPKLVIELVNVAPSLQPYPDSWLQSQSENQLVLVHATQVTESIPSIHTVAANNQMVVVETNVKSGQIYQTLLEQFLPLRTRQLPVLKSLQHTETANKLTSENVISYAWYSAECGASELAISLLSKAYLQAKGSEKEELLMHLQRMRVIAGYYQDAVNEVYAAQYQSKYADKLYYAKAYSAVACNEMAMADEYFKKLGIKAKAKLKDTLAFYRAHGFAIYQFQSGKIDSAIALEQFIEKEIARQEGAHTQLRFINAFILSRFYRERGDKALSIQYLDTCYGSIAGLKSETDHVYSNVIYAAIYEKNGKTMEALIHWLRASIHWLSMRYPEAVGCHAARAILQRTTLPNEVIDIHEIDEYIYQRLMTLATAYNIHPAPITHLQPVFTRLEYIAHTLVDPIYCVGSEVTSFIVAANPILRHYYHNNDKLKHLVLGLLDYFECLPHMDRNQCIIIDAEHNIEVPLTLKHVLKRCMLLNVLQLYYDKHAIDLSAGDLSALLPAITLKLSPAILAIKPTDEGEAAVYKRFFKDYPLDRTSQALLKQIKSNPAYTLDEALSIYTLDKLMELEAAKIIYFDFNDNQMAAIMKAEIKQMRSVHETAPIWD